MINYFTGQLRYTANEITAIFVLSSDADKMIRIGKEIASIHGQLMKNSSSPAAIAL
jgi:hypothetical protein